jgi:hypothetical protein
VSNKRGKKKSHTATDDINQIKNLTTSSLANGDIHQFCMDGTRHNILKEIQNWSKNATSAQILWLNGVAGSGKSTVAQQMAREWKEDSRLAGRFFFSRDAEETRTTKLFFSTVAQQGISHLGANSLRVLAAGIRELRDPVSATLEEQCFEIFVKPLKETSASIVLLLDALDECEPETCERLLNIILAHLPKLLHLKLFITSRPDIHIRQILGRYPVHSLSLQLDDKANVDDVAYYMKHMLQKAPLEEDRISQLINRAGGLFIWARTVCVSYNTLRGDKDAFIERVLSQKIRKMDALYRIALEQAIGRNDEEESVLAYNHALKIIVAAYEPLSPSALDRLLNTTDAMELINDLGSLLECHGPDAVIRFLHPTFREFLLSPQDSGQFHVDIGAAHCLLSDLSLSVMNEDLGYDMCKLSDGVSRNYTSTEYPGLCMQHTSEALRYCSNFWGDHIAFADKEAIKQTRLLLSLEGFFKERLLDWIYLISMRDLIDKATTMLRKIISTELVSKHCEIDDLILTLARTKISQDGL